MIVNYNSLSSGRDTMLKNDVGDLIGSPPIHSARRSISSYLMIVFALLSVVLGQSVQAQSIVNYAFTSSSSGTLEDLSSGATSIMTGNNDTAATSVQPIGFDFWFMGTKYSYFSANANGQFRLHAASGDSAISSGSITSYTAGTNTFALFSGDNEVNNGIRMKVVGTAPNRKLVIEWNQFYVGWADLTNAGNMQAWLSETTGTVEYVYGAIYNANSSAASRAIFISAGNTATTAAHVVIGASPTFVPGTSPATTSFAAGSGTATGSPLLPNIGSTADGSRRIYTFAPSQAPAPSGLNISGITGNGMTLNWTDNASDESGYAVFRSTDNINFTLIATTAANAVSYSATGLSFGTTYHWKIASVREILGTPTAAVSAATNAASLSGVVTVGSGGTYQNLTQAFAAINSSGLNGNIEIQLIAGYPAVAETYPIVSSNALAVGSFSVKVYPTVSGLSITSANASGTLNLANATNLTIDGRVNQAGPMDLIISNSNAGTSPAIQFLNDASNNIIQYCSIKSRNTSTSSGTIVFGTTTGANGNDNNTIRNCDIADESSTPVNGIYASGTTTNASTYNDNNTISNNNIYNFFSATSGTNGILVASGNAAWTISGNSFYQTASRTYTSANTHSAINVSNGSGGNNYTITGNFIGGSTANAGGSAYTMNGTVATLFRGITLSAGTGTASNIQNNVVRNFSLTTSSGTTTAPGIFGGINVTAGAVNIGTVTGNTIGAASGNGSISITSTTNGGLISGIYATSSGAVEVRNNTVASITAAGGVTIGYTFNGISLAGSPTNRIVSNNTVGGATANSITIGAAASTATSTLAGIYDSGSPTSLTMNNNIVRGCTILGAAGTIHGLRASTTTATVSGNQVYDNAVSSTTSAGSTASIIYGYYNFGSPTVENITNNQFYNLGLTVNNTASATANFIAGIYTNTVASAVKTISGNQIYGLGFANSGTGSATIYGIRTVLATTQNIFKNKVYGLSANGASSIVNGILVESGTTSTVYNNLVGGLTASASGLTAPNASVIGLNLAATAGTTNAYYNTVNIQGAGGTNFGSAAVFANTGGTVNLRNNIFVNSATPNGTGKTVAYQRSSATLTNYAATSNNNLFYAGTPGANNLIYVDGTNSDQTLAAFKSRMATRDQGSVTESPNFVSTTGSSADFLHVNTAIGTQIESGGATIATFTDDFDGDARNATTPDMGADEFAGTPAAVVVINNINITPSGVQCTAASRTVTANVTAGASDITSVVLNYAFNGVAQTPITMTGGTLTAGSTSTFSATIPVAVPVNAIVTWTVVATDPVASKSSNGTSYADEPTLGQTATASASISPVCPGSPSVLSVVMNPIVKMTDSFEAGITGFASSAASGTASLTQSATYFAQGTKSMLLTTTSTSADVRASSASNIDLAGAAQAVLKFSHIVAMEGPTTAFDFGYVQYSTDGGTNWTTFPTSSYQGTGTLFNSAVSFSTKSYPDWTAAFTSSSSIPNNALWKTETINIPAAALTSQFRIRFRYTTDNVTQYFGWLIDNVSVETSVTPGSITWSDGTNTVGTGASVTVNPMATTTYSASVVLGGGCSVTSNPVTVSTNVAALATTVSPSDTNLCLGSPITLTATPTGGCVPFTYSWSDGTNVVGTAATLTVTPTVNTTYTVTVTDHASSTATASSAITLYNPQPAASNVTKCAPSASFTLNATPSVPGHLLNWYSAATGGTLLASGTSFVTPVISTTTTYYAEETDGISGLGNTAIPAGTGASAERGIVFTATSSFKLLTAQYYSPTTSVSNNVTIKLVNDATGTQVATKSVTIAQGTAAAWYTMNIGFDITPGTYRLLATFSSSVNRVETGATYPLPLAGLGSITSGYDGSATTASYNYFHNITIGNCVGTRVPVVASISAPPALTLSAAASAICAGVNSAPVTVSSNVADFNTYVWSPATGVTGSPSGYIFNPTTTTTYTLTATQTDGSQCTNTVTHTVTVNPLPTFSTAVATPSTICAGEVSVLNAAGPVSAPSAYTFSGASATYSSITGTATTAIGDDFGQGSLPIGFTFSYNGTSFTTFSAGSNGFIELGSALTYTTNATATWTTSNNSLSTRANIIAPFWDDNNTTGGSVVYSTTGSAGSRVLTVQWTGMHVGGSGSATNPTISMQLKLYEGSNNIQFVYGPTSAALSSPTASIGLSGNVGNYKSVTPLSPASASTVSSSSENTNATETNIPSGTTYTLSPVSSGNVVWSPTANLYTDAAATIAYTGTNAERVYAKLTAPATYTATLTNANNCVATQNVSVAIGNPTVADITGDSSVCLPGSENTITLSNTTPTGIWSSSNEEIATVSSSGVVTPVAAGTVTISYAVTADGCTTTKTHEVAVNAPVAITSSTPTQTVVTGGNTLFTVNATGTGTPALTYFWEVCTDGTGVNFEPVTNGGVYSGADTATLSLTNVPEEYNLYFYQCTVTGACNAVISDLAVLFVGETGIEVHPEGQMNCDSGNGEASFTVVASADVTAYQWQEDQGGDLWTDITDGGMYSGANTATLSLSGLTLANNGWRYKCVVTGIGTAESNPATLTIVQTPVVDTAPTAQAVCYTGGSASFNVAASGGITSYLWQYSSDNGANWNAVANGTPAGASYTGVNSATLNVTTTAATPTAGNYRYRAIVNGIAPCGSAVSADAQLIINNPTITTAPVAATANAVSGAPASFTVVANTYVAATYQWQYATTLGGTYTNVANNTPAGITYSGANSATLTVSAASSVSASSAHYYRVVVSSGTGCSVNSAGAQLTVTNYCVPVAATSSSSYFTSFATTGGVSNISNTSVFTTGGYASYVNQSASQYQGDPINFTTGLAGTTVGVSVFVDWNSDGDFTDSGEVVATTTDYVSTFTGSFTVPANATAGSKRMRIYMDFNRQNPSTFPCGPFGSGRGEMEDYTFNVLVKPACTGNPVAGTISASVTQVCISGTSVLTATGYAPGVTGTSLQWYSTTTGLISGATNPTYTTPTLTATDSFFMRVTCENGGGFSDTNTVTVNVNAPSVTGTTPATRCGTGTVALAAGVSAGATPVWYAAQTGGAALAIGSNFTTPSIAATTNYYVSAEIIAAGTATLGAGASNSTSAPYSFGDGGYGGMKGQYLITADELRAAGVRPGNITSIAFDVVTPGSVLQGFTVQMGNTSLTTFPTPVSIVGGLNTVVNSASFTQTAGVNTLNFNTPFNWDGTSNVIVSTSWSNNNTSNTGVSVRYDATSNYASQSYRKDSVTAASMLAFTGATGEGSSFGYTFDRSQNRPKMIFGAQNTSNCQSSRTMVAATVNSAPALTLSSSTASVCGGTATGVVSITSNLADFDTYSWSPSSGVSGSAATGYTFNPSISTVYTLNALQSGGAQCSNSATFTVAVNPAPSALTVTPADVTICSNGAAQLLTATGGNVAPIMSENFDGATAPGWTIVNGASSPSASNFYYQSAPYTDSAGSATFSNFTTVQGGKFALSNSDAGGSGSTSNSQLISPSFSTVGLSAATLTFEHAYKSWSSDTTVKLEISTDGGTNWFQLADYKGTSVGNSSNNTQTTAAASVSLSGYLNQPNVKIRFNYVSAWGYYWIVDNVVVSEPSTGAGSVTWSPVAGLYTDAAATVPYTGTATRTVYAKPSVTTMYTSTATTAANCQTTTTANVTVNTATVWYVDIDGDGYGNSALPTVLACTQPANTAAQGGDCNDAVASIHPNAVEVPFNGVDDDCDGSIDETGTVNTTLLSSSCGVTLASIGSIVGIQTVGGHPITGYRIRITNGTEVQVLEKTVPHFTITQFPSYAYATTYTVDIQLQRAGIWQASWGTTCLVSTPAILEEGGAASVSPSQCGITLPKINTLIATTSLAGVTGYRFRVTNLTDPLGPNAVQTIDRTQNWFSLQMLTRYNYGTTYRIEVSVKTTGAFGGFGAPCEVSSPAVPSLVNCGGIVASGTATIAATSVEGATQYRFQIVRQSDNASTTIDRSQNWFIFNSVPASAFTAGALYTVRVAVMTKGTWSPFGDACEITAPGALAKGGNTAGAEASVSDVFKATAYPNPYTADFSLDVITSSKENVQLQVYDMLGKLIETREVKFAELDMTKVGAQYPSGVYNVIVSQEGVVRTLRVIKR